MTGAVLPALREQPDLAPVWEPRIRTRSYDQRLIEPSLKTGNLSAWPHRKARRK